MPRQNHRAFSLVEVLVVVAIIALLVAILLPTLSTVRESARTTNCLANLRGIGTAMQLYASDTRGNQRGFFPPSHVRDNASPTYNRQNYVYALVTAGYVSPPSNNLGSASITRTPFYCPNGTDTPGSFAGVLVPSPGYPSGIIRELPQPLYEGFNGYWENYDSNSVAADPNRTLYRTWYAVNGSQYRQSAMPWAGPNAGHVGGDVETNRLRLLQIRRPSSLVLLFDGFGYMFSGIAIPYSARHNFGTVTNMLLTDNAVVSAKSSTLPQGRFENCDTPDSFPKWNIPSVK